MTKSQHTGSLCFFFFFFCLLFVAFGYQQHHRQVLARGECKLPLILFFVLLFLGVSGHHHQVSAKGELWLPFFFFSFNAPFVFFIVIPFLFSNVSKKVCFILFCGFCNFGRCKPKKKQGLLEKRSMPQLNWQMAWEVS